MSLGARSTHPRTVSRYWPPSSRTQEEARGASIKLGFAASASHRCLTTHTWAGSQRPCPRARQPTLRPSAHGGRTRGGHGCEAAVRGAGTPDVLVCPAGFNRESSSSAETLRTVLPARSPVRPTLPFALPVRDTYERQSEGGRRPRGRRRGHTSDVPSADVPRSPSACRHTVLSLPGVPIVVYKEDSATVDADVMALPTRLPTSVHRHPGFPDVPVSRSSRLRIGLFLSRELWDVLAVRTSTGRDDTLGARRRGWPSHALWTRLRLLNARSRARPRAPRLAGLSPVAAVRSAGAPHDRPTINPWPAPAQISVSSRAGPHDRDRARARVCVCASTVSAARGGEFPDAPCGACTHLGVADILAGAHAPQRDSRTRQRGTARGRGGEAPFSSARTAVHPGSC
ncbi:hypothetical protein BC628DRAFT_624116 [Trametes gibbosa]|nr:hypothetical protein BC628DRAFT_624116 [Trametes gibbosa]